MPKHYNIHVQAPNLYGILKQYEQQSNKICLFAWNLNCLIVLCIWYIDCTLLPVTNQILRSFVHVSSLHSQISFAFIIYGSRFQFLHMAWGNVQKMLIRNNGKIKKKKKQIFWKGWAFYVHFFFLVSNFSCGLQRWTIYNFFVVLCYIIFILSKTFRNNQNSWDRWRKCVCMSMMFVFKSRHSTKKLRLKEITFFFLVFL